MRAPFLDHKVIAIRGQDLEVYGDGRQTRSFAYVDDTVEALVRMMEQGEQIGPVNIGNPDEVTILELASLAKKLLAWEPRVPLNSGLRKTLDHMRSELGVTAT